MKLRFTTRAAQDLVEIARYLHTRNPAAGRRVRAAFALALRQLAQFPKSGRAQRIEGVRKLTLQSGSTLI